MTTTESGGLFDNADIIHVYTREQALADGTLVDVSELARSYGFVFPVAVSRAVWEDCCAWPDDEEAPQDEAGRVWDVLTMLRFAITRSRGNTDRVEFEVLRIPRGGRDPKLARLYALVGPGDDADPVITVMVIGED